MVFYVKGPLGPKTPILHPDNVYLSWWLMSGIAFINYQAFITPYRLCFNAPAKGVFLAVELMVNFYFIIDVVQKFFVSFYDCEGRVVRNHAWIIRKYLKGWSRRAAV